MSLPKIKDFTDFNHYPSDPQPTTDADMQDYMQNQNDILAALTKRLWQPQTEYKLGDIVASDTMADGLVAVCTISGVTSDIEPTWGVNEATVIDNSCTWIMRPAYCYGLATEGDVQTVHDGGSAENSRLLSVGVLDKIFEIFKGRIGELFGDNDVLPIANGGTGATTKAAAQTNLGLNDAIVGLSVSGRTITYTQADGGTGTITTQDTTTPSSIKSTISVTAGTVSDGGTIPLPSGYSRSQCRYAVWSHDMPDANGGYGSGSWHKTQVNQSTGEVFCQYSYDSSTNYRKSGTAGYLCVAVK